MRKSIFFALLFCTLQTFGQWSPTNNSYGTPAQRLDALKTLLGPTFAASPSGPGSLNATDLKQYAQYFDSAHHVFWIYDPKLQTWDSLHIGSIATSVPKSIAGVVGGGGADDPISNATTYVNAKLVGLGPKITIIVNNVQYTNFGANANITFTPGTGTINMAPNKWIVGGSLFINLNQ